MVWSILPTLIWIISAGFQPRMGNSLETTRAPGFSLLQVGPQSFVGAGEEVHGHHVGGAQIHAQGAALHDA